jgi:EpsG family
MFPYYLLGFVVQAISRSINTKGVARWSKDFSHLPKDRNVEGRKGKDYGGFLVPVGYISSALLLIAFAGLRYNTGSDYRLYFSLYRAVDSDSLIRTFSSVPQEAGFVFLMYCLSKISDTPYIIFWAASLITVGPVLYAVYRKSRDPSFAIFLYFFLGYYAVSLNAVRQSISVSLMLLADTYKGTSWLKYLLVSGLAISFHASALIAVAAQLAAEYIPPNFFTMCCVMVATVSFSGAILNSGVVALVPTDLNPRFGSYLTSEGAGIGTILVLTSRILFVAFSLFLPRLTNETNRQISLLMLSPVCLYLGLSTWVVARLEMYFGIFLILLLPNQLSIWRHGATAKKVLSLLLFIYFGFYISKYNNIIPYTLIPEIF